VAALRADARDRGSPATPPVGETSEPAREVTNSSPVPTGPASGGIPSPTPPTSADAAAGGTRVPAG
ncbi:hypothetical protein ABT351_30495, partial [Micromonospora sp. NPDC000018]